MLTSLAGPFTNFILAFIAQIGVAALGSITFRSANIGYDIASVFYMICSYMVIMNLGLAIFNLIPVPPLDGSKVLSSVLPTDLYFKYMQYEQFGFYTAYPADKPAVFQQIAEYVRVWDNGILFSDYLTVHSLGINFSGD